MAGYTWAYRGGKILRYDDMVIHAESIAMRYALSAFEAVRGYTQHDGSGVRYFAFDEHIDRLHRTLSLIGLPAVNDDEIKQAAAKLLEVNSVTADCYLRIAVNAVSLGTLKGTTETEMFISLTPMGRKPWVESGGGLSVCISPWRKAGDDVFPQQAKVISNYAGPRLAYLDARQQGFDDVILTTLQGNLSEAPTANLFLVIDGAVATPRAQDGILLGVTRRHLMMLGRSFGLAVQEAALTAADAHRASEAFLCGTGLELSPIARIDDYVLPKSRPVYTRLAEAYFDSARGRAVKNEVAA
jgi:branched-chain amino acid aminotransferase